MKQLNWNKPNKKKQVQRRTAKETAPAVFLVFFDFTEMTLIHQNGVLLHICSILLLAIMPCFFENKIFVSFQSDFL